MYPSSLSLFWQDFHREPKLFYINVGPNVKGDYRYTIDSMNRTSIILFISTLIFSIWSFISWRDLCFV